VPTGLGKVDNTVMGAPPGAIKAAFDQDKRCIYWSASDSGTSLPTKIFAYHVDLHKWSRADATLRALDQGSYGALNGPYALNQSNALSTPLVATTSDYKVATLTTGDQELNPGSRTFVSGVKPNIMLTSTATAVTVQVGARDNLLLTPTYTATTSPTTSTGFADCRVDAKYHRVSVGITGTFVRAMGLEFRAITTGDR